MFDLSDFFKNFRANLNGTIGELSFLVVAKAYFNNDYHIFNDVVLQAGDRTTQIDLLIISRYGIFVIEVKTYKGWIFGNPNHAQWTQSFYKKKYRFQNPLRQNHFHVKTLQQYFQCPDIIFKSLIVFSGEAKFKTVLPDNVVRGAEDFINYIDSFQSQILSDEYVEHCINVIKHFRLSSGDHKASMKQYREKISNPDSSNAPICPRCNRKMVLRTAKKGKYQGNQFWGCSGYPNCRHTININ